MWSQMRGIAVLTGADISPDRAFAAAAFASSVIKRISHPAVIIAPEQMVEPMR
jgi:hypothetical protein